jgi:hypothetical protein
MKTKLIILLIFFSLIFIIFSACDLATKLTKDQFDEAKANISSTSKSSSASSNPYEHVINTGFYFREVEIDDNNNLYFTDYTNNCIKKYNLTTYQLSTILTLTSLKAMFKNGDNLYIADGNNLIEYNILTGVSNIKISLSYNINCLYYANNYFIINDQSGAWSKNRLIRFSDFTELDNKEWVDPSATSVYFGSKNIVYTLRDGTSPDDICYQVIDPVNNKLGNYGDSMYHGQYNYSHPLKLFPDNSKIITATGNIFNTDDNISYFGNIGYTYGDLIFYNSFIYLLSDNYNEYGKLIKLSDSSPFSLQKKIFDYSGYWGRKIFIKNNNLIVITQPQQGSSYYYLNSNNGTIKVYKYDSSVL